MAVQSSRRRLSRALLIAIGGVTLGFALPLLIVRRLELGLVAGVLAGSLIAIALFLALLLYGGET
ncbi:MAG TPA: hypothetical protein VFD32_13700 [Dehalococcoidia bacterium]|nr:hypothetical protein [Dehalococcoidia bacterium]